MSPHDIVYLKAYHQAQMDGVIMGLITVGVLALLWWWASRRWWR